MRWLMLLGCLTVVGMAQMALGPRLELPAAQGEYLFLIAFAVALHCPRSGILPAFFLAGLARDIFLGSRLGAGVLVYLLAGAVFWFLRDKVEGHHVLLRALFVLFALSVGLSLLPMLEGNWEGWTSLQPAGRDALYTALISPVVLFLLSCLPGLCRPTRKR